MRNDNIQWIIIRQLANDLVYYIDDNENSNTLMYEEFKSFLGYYPLKNWSEFIISLDRFQIIFVNLKTGDWEVKNDTRSFRDFTFEELSNLNDYNEDINKDKTTFLEKLDDKLDKGRRFLDRFRDRFR